MGKNKPTFTQDTEIMMLPLAWKLWHTIS